MEYNRSENNQYNIDILNNNLAQGNRRELATTIIKKRLQFIAEYIFL